MTELAYGGEKEEPGCNAPGTEAARVLLCFSCGTGSLSGAVDTSPPHIEGKNWPLRADSLVHNWPEALPRDKGTYTPGGFPSSSSGAERWLLP